MQLAATSCLVTPCRALRCLCWLWMCYPFIVPCASAPFMFSGARSASISWASPTGAVMDNLPSDGMLGKLSGENGSRVESYLLHSYLEPVVGYFDSSRYTVSLRGDTIFGDPEDFQHAETLQCCRDVRPTPVKHSAGFHGSVLTFTCICKFHPAYVGSRVVSVLRRVLERYRYEPDNLFKTKTAIRMSWTNAAAHLVHRLRALRPIGEESADGRR